MTMEPIVPMFSESYQPLTAVAAPGDEPGAGERWRALALSVRHAFGSVEEPEVTTRIADAFLKVVGGDTAALVRSGAGDLDPVMMRAISERRPVVAQADLASPAMLAVPLHGGRRILGALTATRRRGGAFTRLDLELAETFADQAARFLELVRRAPDLAAPGRNAASQQVIEAERLRAVGQLAGGVAHHLNNIMTVILGNVHAALGSEASLGVRTQLESAERAVLDAADVVRRMSAFSRVRPVPVKSVVDLKFLAGDVLEWTRSRWQAEAQLRGITIRARLEPGDTPSVRGDEAGLREVLLSLVLNAIDALPAGGDIVIRTWQGDASVYCSVSDNGVGMAAETSQRALEPFFTTKGPQSRGLGLSVAYGVVQRHSGSLAITSREGGGSTITFSLPLEAAGVPAQPGTLPRAESPRVLVIDDDVPVRTVLRALLTRDGYTVVEATDGVDALARLDRGEPFDLVLTDLVMPGVNGSQVLRAVRRLRPDLPVVVITGWEQATADGDDVADATITKPVTDVELRETVARVLARR
jgi:signal transduction histidine kinase/CheY-like chemotaxis protein